MTNYLSLIGTIVASIVALSIAVWNARRADRLRTEDRQAAAEQREQDRQDAIRAHQAEQLARLLTLHSTIGPPVFIPAMAPTPPSKAGEMKAILLTLPGHLATLVRHRLNMGYTMAEVALDAATAARLKDDVGLDASHKFRLFDRNSAAINRVFDPVNPHPEWVEAELAYDIAGLRGGDQDAVLAALSRIQLKAQ